MKYFLIIVSLFLVTSCGQTSRNNVRNSLLNSTILLNISNQDRERIDDSFADEDALDIGCDFVSGSEVRQHLPWIKLTVGTERERGISRANVTTFLVRDRVMRREIQRHDLSIAKDDPVVDVVIEKIAARSGTTSDELYRDLELKGIKGSLFREYISVEISWLRVAALMFGQVEPSPQLFMAHAEHWLLGQVEQLMNVRVIHTPTGCLELNPEPEPRVATGPERGVQLSSYQKSSRCRRRGGRLGRRTCASP